MFQRFTGDARERVTEAMAIAREMGAMSVEAEHLLLAVARSDSPAGRLLADAGLDEDALREALAAETTRSLAAVGVTVDALHFSPFVQSPKLGTSAKTVLEQSMRMAVGRGDKHIGSEHLTMAALMPARGTVPRALDGAGVDRAALISALSA
ncbi:Clp protease N-terminal domain-containing protein [Solirubrobacter soli]|uniref:Clp protease N-terminal domain-containing protein n=1 Tax=Solirubrobacter soli TaxID=363832 RepID=UPI0003F7C20F|nr:Clp protease N-terminal domain-containing protein [Solirubrobacter soli]